MPLKTVHPVRRPDAVFLEGQESEPNGKVVKTRG